MSSLAATERASLCDLLTELGPDAPTLCEGWTTRDLAAHLIVREGRPDAVPGVLISIFAGHTKSVQDAVAIRPYEELVSKVRSGPPLWNPMRIGPIADAVNSLEFLVHHEDARRGSPDWVPRELPAEVQDQAWSRLLRVAKLNFKSSPVGVVLRRPDGTTSTARKGDAVVTLTGDPVELVLVAFGRTANQVRIDGDADDIARFKASKRGI